MYRTPLRRGFFIEFRGWNLLTFSRDGRLDWIYAGCLSAILMFIYYSYQQGFSGGLFFDDYPNLTDLSNVHDIESALGYIFNGGGGPLGRPIAFLSFILNAPSWPTAMNDFLYTNTCIHLINGMLLIWLAFRLALFFPERIASPEGFALSVGVLWLAHPLLVSANLMTVQRMTTLSATFVLGGLLVFVHGIGFLDTKPRRAFWLISSGIVFGTAFAALTKENGVLLPLWALIIQAVLLSQINMVVPSWFRWWRGAFLVAPIVAVLIYFAFIWPQISNGYVFREFDLKERLLTQPRVLADYLYLILVPLRTALGPYHDDFVISHGLFSPISTLVSLLFWGMAIAGAIFFRKKYPIVCFGLLWFVAGHSIESSVFALENYFEHRNYLPSIGPLFVICYFTWATSGKWKTPSRIAFAAYIGLVLIVFHATTSVWGKPYLAAELWYGEHPNSERAAQTLAQLYARKGLPREAQQVISESSRRHPTNIGLSLQTLQVSCGLGIEQQILDELGKPEAQSLLKRGAVSPLICDSLDKISNMAIDNQCGLIKASSLHQIIDPILQNPKIRFAPEINYCLHDVKAMLYYDERNLDLTMRHLESAFSHKQYLNLAVRMVEFPASAGLYDEALENIRFVLDHKPKNPIVANIWETRLAKIRVDIETLRHHAEPVSRASMPVK